MSSSDIFEVIRLATDEPGPSVILACARTLLTRRSLLDSKSLELIFAALLAVDATHQQTLRQLDIALCALLGTPHETQALYFLTALLSKPLSTIKLSDFGSFAHQIARSDMGRLYGLLVRWLLSGNQQICRELASILSALDQNVSFDATAQSFTMSPREQVFLCRKAIGFLFLKPALVASILVSVLRACDEETTKTVRDLLFDPLLINFGGGARAYLSEIPDGDIAHPAVRQALGRHTEYVEALRQVPPIEELHPSEYRRAFVRRHVQDEMRTARKMAETESVLLSVVRRSVILYGRRSLIYVQDAERRRRPVEMDLKSIGGSMEIPSAEITDPVGLDYMLRIFRVERIQA